MYPIFLNLKGIPVLVVGGGRVATRKVESLLEADAAVTVISPTLSESLARLVSYGDCRWKERAFAPGDTEGFRLIFAATDSREQNAEIAEEARQIGALVNVADSPEESSFHVPATVRRGDVVLAVSTGGGSPLLARRIREELEERYGEEYALLNRLLAEVRVAVRGALPTQAARQALYEAILDSEVLTLLRNDDLQAAQSLISRLIREAKETR